MYNDQPSPETEIEWLLGDAYCTDDDTNVEYMFLHMMEVYGVNDISYDDFAEEFLFHCQNYVWCANLEARELMRSGVLPPMSGQKQYNSQWSAIDAQIESEIFGMTAPGNPVDAIQTKQVVGFGGRRRSGCGKRRLLRDAVRFGVLPGGRRRTSA